MLSGASPSGAEVEGEQRIGVILPVLTSAAIGCPVGTRDSTVQLTRLREYSTTE